MQSEVLHLQRQFFEGKDFIITDAINNNSITVFRKDCIMEPICIDRVNYCECTIGDHILINYEYNGTECVKRFKVIGKDMTGLFFICKSDPTEEEAIYLQLMEIMDKVQKGVMGTDEAHIAADEILIKLLYQKKMNLIADIYLQIPKWYS